MKLFAAAATCGALLLTPSFALGADETVKQAQTMLNVLGYKVGTPDGAAGKKTLAAITKVMTKYGQTFDGEISGNEVAFLAAIVPQKLTVDFGVAVSEISLLDAADINGDGRKDFVVTAMADPAAQLGIPCCEVPADRVPDIVSPIPMLVYTTPAGFAVQAFPDEAKGNRSQSGRFFTTPTGTYFVLGKNGEMGLPDDNHGEVSLVLRLTPNEAGVGIETVARFDGPGVTANVEVADLDGNGQPEIYLNNYNFIGPVTDADVSSIKEFGADEQLHPTTFTAALESQKPINFVRLMDIDGNGVLDLLAAAEVHKSLDVKRLESKGPGSYVILDAFARKTVAADRIYLLPPHFGDDQAGFSLMPLSVDGRVFIFEVAMQFLGHQGGGFVNDNLDVFEFSATDKTMTPVTKQVLPKVSAKREKAGGYYLLRADLDFDGVDEVYREHYAQKPQYMDWNGTLFALKDYPSTDYFKPGWLGMLIYLPDPALKCTRMATFPEYIGQGHRKMTIQLTTCAPATDFK
jgi:peptidoglycan hydrolase-like protein with peptidoglycan-binding domain